MDPALAKLVAVYGFCKGFNYAYVTYPDKPNSSKHTIKYGPIIISYKSDMFTLSGILNMTCKFLFKTTVGLMFSYLIVKGAKYITQ